MPLNEAIVSRRNGAAVSKGEEGESDWCKGAHICWGSLAGDDDADEKEEERGRRWREGGEEENDERRMLPSLSSLGCCAVAMPLQPRDPNGVYDTCGVQTPFLFFSVWQSGIWTSGSWMKLIGSICSR